jgi:hypothetical protein
MGRLPRQLKGFSRICAKRVFGEAGAVLTGCTLLVFTEGTFHFVLPEP